MLFQMVEGHDLDGLLLKLVECIPWNALASALKGDGQWFALSTTSSQMTDSSPHQTTSSAVTPPATDNVSHSILNTPISTPRPYEPEWSTNQHEYVPPANLQSTHTPGRWRGTHGYTARWRR